MGILCFLYLILSIICFYIVTFDHDSSPGEFFERKRTVVHKKGLSEKVESRELNKRTNKPRFVVKKAGWKLDFIPSLLLIPVSFIPGMGAIVFRRRLCDLDPPTERRRLAAQKPGQLSWLSLLIQCLALGLADWFYLHYLRKQGEGPLIQLYH